MENPNHTKSKHTSGILSEGDPLKNLAMFLLLFFGGLIVSIVVFFTIVEVVSAFLP